MEVVINIPQKAYEQIIGFPQQTAGVDILILHKILQEGVVLPKGHGRLIDADAFIDGLRDSSKRQRYNECLINEFLTVDDVFQAVIESLENKGLAEGDAPTIIEADETESEE